MSETLMVDTINKEDFKKVDFSSWDTLKNHIRIRLMNIKAIDKYKEAAFRKVMDWAAIFCIYETSKDGKYMSYIITNEDIDIYGIDIQILYDVSINNMANDRKRRIYRFREHLMKKNVFSPIMEISNKNMSIGGENAGLIIDVDEENNENILIVSNKQDKFGAGYILVPNIINEVYERLGENFYIIPMSVHQVMCIKQSYVNKNNSKPEYEVEDDLLTMIGSINDSVDSWQEILSYRIYYYLGDDGCKIISIKP